MRWHSLLLSWLAALLAGPTAAERRAAALGTGFPAAAPEQGHRQGTGEAVIEHLQVLAPDGRPLERLASGGRLVIELAYRCCRPLDDLALSLGLYTAGHVKCWEVSFASVRARFGPLAGAGRLRCEIERLPLTAGRYAVNVGLYPTDFAVVYDYHWDMHTVWVDDDGVAAGTEITGVVALTASWSRLA